MARGREQAYYPWWRETIAMPMHPALLPLLPFAAAVPTILHQEGLPQSSAVEVVAAKADRHDRLTVPVRIGAHGPFDFLIDTGSQNTVLSSALASKLALVPTARARLVGVAGSEMVDTVEIDQIDLGRRSYYGLLAPILQSEHIGADGILGIDSLQDQRVLMDFRKNLLAIDDAKALGGNRGYEIIVTARHRSGQLIMADAKIDGIATDVVIDTGAQNSIGNLALQRALTRRGSHGTVVLNSVTGQAITAQIGFGRMLTIQEMNLNNVWIAFADAPAFEALGLNRKPALLLGMQDLRSFDRVAIDFSTRRILFDLPREAF